MTGIRFVVWVAVGCWCFIALNFTVSFLYQRTRIRSTWPAAALGALAYLLLRLNPRMPALLTTVLTVFLTMAGLILAPMMLLTLVRKGWKVLK